MGDRCAYGEYTLIAMGAQECPIASPVSWSHRAESRFAARNPPRGASTFWVIKLRPAKNGPGIAARAILGFVRSSHAGGRSLLH